MPRCPYCEASIPGGLRSCPECEAPLKPIKKRRSSAGAESPERAARSGDRPPRRQPRSQSKAPLFIGVGLGALLLLLVGVFLVLRSQSDSEAEDNNVAGIVNEKPAEDRRVTRNRLKQLGLSLHNYHDTFGTFPPGGVYDLKGGGHHSWQTFLLPYMDQAPLFEKIDYNVPWTHPKNAAYFQVELRDYCRESDEPRKNDQGFGLSHWSANPLVMNHNSVVRIRDMQDGLSNTVLAGEVVGDFSPWGHPGNWRDLGTGINKGPHSYGNPNHPSGMFLLGDGQVREISENIDPKTLQALATPRGNEPPGSF